MTYSHNLTQARNFRILFVSSHLYRTSLRRSTVALLRRRELASEPEVLEVERQDVGVLRDGGLVAKGCLSGVDDSVVLRTMKFKAAFSGLRLHDEPSIFEAFVRRWRNIQWIFDSKGRSGDAVELNKDQRSH